MSKNYLLPTNIIVSLDPCPLSSIFFLFLLLWQFCFRIRDLCFSAFPCFNRKIDATLSRAFSNSPMVSQKVFLIDFKLSINSSFASWLNLWPDLICSPFDSNSASSSSVTFAFSSSILTFSFERSPMLFSIVVASWRFAIKFSSVNIPVAAGLSEVTKAKLWFIAFKASWTSHWSTVGSSRGFAFFQSQNSGESVPCMDKWS